MEKSRRGRRVVVVQAWLRLRGATSICGSVAVSISDGTKLALGASNFDRKELL